MKKNSNEFEVPTASDARQISELAKRICKFTTNNIALADNKDVQVRILGRPHPSMPELEIYNVTNENDQEILIKEIRTNISDFNISKVVVNFYNSDLIYRTEKPKSLSASEKPVLLKKILVE